MASYKVVLSAKADYNTKRDVSKKFGKLPDAIRFMDRAIGHKFMDDPRGHNKRPRATNPWWWCYIQNMETYEKLFTIFIA